jgi:hypothetical protein
MAFPAVTGAIAYALTLTDSQAQSRAGPIAQNVSSAGFALQHVQCLPSSLTWAADDLTIAV